MPRVRVQVTEEVQYVVEVDVEDPEDLSDVEQTVLTVEIKDMASYVVKERDVQVVKVVDDREVVLPDKVMAKQREDMW